MTTVKKSRHEAVNADMSSCTPIQVNTVSSLNCILMCLKLFLSYESRSISYFQKQFKIFNSFIIELFFMLVTFNDIY